MRDFANESALVSFDNFITRSSGKETVCIATLEIEYPVMPKDMRKNYREDIFKGVLFDGGVIEKQISYSAQYTDDNEHIYVQLLSY